jgi:transglutaminase-like putative cysteine protease
MKHVLTLLLLIAVVLGLISPKYGFYTHAIADEIANHAGSIRGENPFTNVAVKVIQVTNRSPYLLPSKIIESTDPQIIQLANEITQGKTTDAAKSYAIYNWVTHHITYNVLEYKWWQEDFKHYTYPSALETLKKGSGICMGFARLNAALHRAVGIEAKIVFGQEHAWNQIKLDGRWQNQDTTYGAGYINTNNNQFIQAYNPIYFSYEGMEQEGEFQW